MLEKEKKLNEIKSRFVATASHEFKTPLTTIQSSTNLLKKYVKNGQTDKLNKHFTKIIKNVEGLNQILKRFLSLEEINQGIHKPILVQVNIAQLFEELTEGFTNLMKLGQKFDFQIEANQILTDPGILNTILSNLVSNAIKYSSENTTISLLSTHVGKETHIIVKDGDKINSGDIMVKIPRKSGKSGDITGGLPRVTEMFEARNPSNPAVVSEIDGVASYGRIKRGNREVVIEARTGEIKKYLIPLSRHILVQENDFVKAGQTLSDGAITPKDILSIKGPTAVQEYIVNEIQEVYRLQGVKINDKHFEVIVRQMMRKVQVNDPGDTKFLENTAVNKWEFILENDKIFGKKVVTDSGDSTELKAGQIVSARKLRDENSALKRNDKKLVDSRDALTATAEPILQGITKASLHTDSFISAASFQETTKVLNQAAVNGKVDHMLGLKENVIVGHKIPAGTGMRNFRELLVGSIDDLNRMTSKDEETVEEKVEN